MTNNASEILRQDIGEEIQDIRLKDLKRSIVAIRMANSQNNKLLVDTYCIIMAAQLKSLEYAIEHERGAAE